MKLPECLVGSDLYFVGHWLLPAKILPFEGVYYVHLEPQEILSANLYHQIILCPIFDGFIDTSNLCLI